VLFLSCKANAGVKLPKKWHGPHSSKSVIICVVQLLFVLFYVLFVFLLFYVLFVCKCVLYYCHRVLTQLQLTNISFLMSNRTFIQHHKILSWAGYNPSVSTSLFTDASNQHNFNPFTSTPVPVQVMNRHLILIFKQCLCIIFP